MKINLFIILALIVMFSCNQAKPSFETTDSANRSDKLIAESTMSIKDDDRMEIKSEKGIIDEIKFPIAYIWEYKWEYNEEYSDYDDNEGQMWAYYEPELKYWLFTREQSYGILGDLYDWVLIKPDGTCLFQTQDEFEDKKVFFELKIDLYKTDILDDTYTPTGKNEKFVYELYNNLTFEGKEYQKSYLKTSEECYVYLADTDIDLSPIYSFNALQNQTEIRLPIYFQTDLPPNKILLRETTDAYYGQGVTELKWITLTEYYIYITDEPMEIFE